MANTHSGVVPTVVPDAAPVVPGAKAYLDRPRLERILDEVLTRAQAAGAAPEYRLVGTSAPLLQGVDLPAGDVDLLVRERADVGAFSRALSDLRCLAEPSYLERSRQYYAAYEVEGLR